MKLIILLILILLTVPPADAQDALRDRDIVVLLLNSIDFVQTATSMKNGGVELNPVLPRRMTTGQAFVSSIAGTVAMISLLHILPRQYADIAYLSYTRTQIENIALNSLVLRGVPRSVMYFYVVFPIH